MNHASFLALTHNAALLLAMVFIYDIATSRDRAKFDPFKTVLTGFALGLIGGIIMLTPWEYAPGIIVDSRSVLLGISGLFFGPVPTVIAMVMTGILRFFQGGEATLTGIGVILSSGSLGLAWHYYRRRPLSELTVREIYLFGLVIHGVMLAMMFTLPLETALKVLSSITLPVLLIYPVITVIIGVLFIRRIQRDQTAAALRESEFLFRSQFDLGNIGISISTREKKWIRVNPRLCAMLGYNEEELLRLSWPEISHPDDLMFDQDQFNRMLSSDTDGYTIDKRFIRKDGEIVYVHMTIACFRVEGKVQLVIASMQDITENKQAEESMQLASLVYQNSSEAMVVTDRKGKIITTNPAFSKMTGYSAGEIKEKNAICLVSREQDNGIFPRIVRALDTSAHWQGEIHNRHKNGNSFITLLTINSILNNDGSVHRHVAQFSDITDKKKSEEIIWRQANFDSLTGLPNRRMFLDKLEQEKKSAYRAGLPLALLFIDLDGFKEVNDTLGHNMGDLLLQEAAHRLRDSVRETDIVSRLGGDEFTVILNELENLHHIELVAQRILQQLAVPFSLGLETVDISASIGITLYPEDGLETETLLKHADQAMYAAKENGRNRYHFFTAAMQEEAQYRRQIANELRNAIKNNQLELHYQPIIELETSNITKAEALLRWNHPELGQVSPAEFIPVAEETGIIVEIGDWVFRQAADQAARWRASHHPEFQISINISPRQLSDRGNDIPGWLNHLQALGLPGQAVILEITEGLLLDANKTVTDKLLTFRDNGIQVSLDDFGTGYSSLSYIQKFHVDNIKIDQSFVRNLKESSDELAVCEAITVMAHKLGMPVIAEGVETDEQRGLLATAGCDFGQGYRFARPLPAKAFSQLLSKQDATTKQEVAEC